MERIQAIAEAKLLEHLLGPLTERFLLDEGIDIPDETAVESDPMDQDEVV